MQKDVKTDTGKKRSWHTFVEYVTGDATVTDRADLTFTRDSSPLRDLSIADLSGCTMQSWDKTFPSARASGSTMQRDSLSKIIA